MAPVLHLSCLGPPQVAAGSGDPVRFRTRKHLALLVRLAVEPGRRFTRDYLTDLLWPEAPARLANHSLAQALSVIREKVGRANVFVQRATVALGEGAVDVDIQHLDGPAVGIRGTFLEGFDVPAARPFEDWKDEWRAKLLPRMRDALVRQMDAGRRVGDFAAVERHAAVLLDLDPLSEDGVRGTIEARAWVGDRSSALKAYAAYAARLSQELNAKPGPELQRMADLLREGRRDPANRPRAVGEPAARAERRFEAETVVGREREFSVLYDAWLSARRRSPAIIVLTGDPGLGKTTLANAFVSTCQLEGAVVARAQAYDAERELPFAVLAELVRQLALQRAIGGADPEALSELSRLTPEVAAQFPGVPKPVEWAAEIVPLRLADAFLKTVAAAADESPLVLVVDDIHAADNASTAILHMVARKLTPTRLLVILAARSAELRASGAPGALTSDASIEALRPLDLEPLPDDSATRLVERVRVAAGAQPDADFPLERVLRAGRGNPLALELLTREWVAHGPESLLRDLEAVNTQPAAAIGIPRAIKVVFERQVARLDAKTRAVLDLAAVLGRRLSDLALYEAADCTAMEAGEALARLRDEGFLREVRGDVEFRNELLRAQAYYAVPAPTRQFLHRRIAALLQIRSPEMVGPSWLEIAWHFLRGGASREATTFAVVGGEAALSVGAPSEAEHILHAVLGEVPDLLVAGRIQQLLARALIDQSKGGPALPILDALESTASRMSPRDRAEVFRLRASAEYLVNQDGSTGHKEMAERAVKAAREAADAGTLVDALFEYARAGAESGDDIPLRSARKELLDLVGSSTQPAPAMAYYGIAYSTYFLEQNVKVAGERLATAVSLLEGQRRLGELSLAYNGLGVCLQELLETRKAEEAFQSALELAKEIADDSRCSIIAGNLCTLFSVEGRYEDAIEIGRRSIQFGRRALNQPLMLHSYMNLAEVYTLSGRPDEARHYWCEAEKRVREENRWRANVEFLIQSAIMALLEGSVAKAINFTSAALEQCRGRGDRLGAVIGFRTMQAFWLAHTQGFAYAHRVVRRTRDTFRDRNPFLYFELTAVLSWIERSLNGAVSEKTASILSSPRSFPFPGRRALLAAQGFLAELSPKA